MKRLGWGFLAGLVFAGAVQAQDGGSGSQAGAEQSASGSSDDSPAPAPNAAAPSQDRGSRQIQGRVKSIDRKQSTFTLLGSSKTFQVTPSTEVIKNDSIGTLDAVLPGDYLTAIFDGSSAAQGTQESTGQTVKVDRIRAWTSSPVGSGSGGVGHPVK